VPQFHGAHHSRSLWLNQATKYWAGKEPGTKEEAMIAEAFSGFGVRFLDFDPAPFLLALAFLKG
jgi:hypothetical protein